MAVRTWGFGSGDWFDPSQWIGAVAPLPDDTVVLDGGTAIFAAGETLEAATIDFGGSVLGDPVLLLQDELLGFRTTIDSTGVSSAQGMALLADFGASGFGGVIDASEAGGTFEIDASNTATPGNLTLLTGASVTVDGGDTMLLFGTLSERGGASIGGAGSGTFVNDGTIAEASAAFEVASGGTLAGSGLYEIGLYSSLNFQPGSAASSVTIRFTDVGGRLLLADPASFTGSIENFQTGDLIDLTSIAADAANYDPQTGVLTVMEGDNVVATLTLLGAAGDEFTTAPDTDGGTLVGLTGSQPRLNYTIDAADRAMAANVVRATMTTLSGTPIDGAGIRIGIISNSFDEAPGVGTADVANAAAEAGYLPENPNGTSAVTVLGDAIGSGDDNEGLAMAELVHQVAPGASIDFASGSGGVDEFSTAVAGLMDAGCNVIVDDLYDLDEPFFQDADALDGTIGEAARLGVSYFTSAGNVASSGYQATFSATPQTLSDSSFVSGQQFSNGTPYQTVTLIGGTDAIFDLEWAAPWLSPGDHTSSVLQMKLFDMSGNLVASSTLDGGEGNVAIEPQTSLSFTPGTTAQYQLAIYGSVPAGTVFKYILVGHPTGGGTNLAGTIDDPAANAGTVMGHAMLPEVTTVGAVDFADTPEFGAISGYASYYSSTGDAEFLFDENGNPIDDVVAKPNLVAPVDAATSLTGFAPFNGTSAAAPEAAAVAALMLQADPALTPAQVQSLMEDSTTSLGQPADAQGAGAVDADEAVRLALEAAAACYAQGTRLATSRGLVAVERLRVGDTMVTESGALRPVVWLGHRRIDCRRHRRPAEVWPVRVQAHAFAPQQPGRALVLSPDHAVKVAGVLVPIRYLVNGATVAQAQVASVTYWHVELPSHDVVLAEGLPCESFLDTGNRSAFAGGGVEALHPDFSRRVWAERGCAPLLTDGPLVDEAREGLLARAARLGHRLGRDAGLRARVGGRTVALAIEGARCRLCLPTGAAVLRLSSRTWVPAHLGESDGRRLGIAVGRLAMDGVAVALDDARLVAGWHAPELVWRWTDGAATLRTDGVREVAFELMLPGSYWQAPRSRPAGVAADRS